MISCWSLENKKWWLALILDPGLNFSFLYSLWLCNLKYSHLVMVRVTSIIVYFSCIYSVKHV